MLGRCAVATVVVALLAGGCAQVSVALALACSQTAAGSPGVGAVDAVAVAAAAGDGGGGGVTLSSEWGLSRSTGGGVGGLCALRAVVGGAKIGAPFLVFAWLLLLLMVSVIGCCLGGVALEYLLAALNC